MLITSNHKTFTNVHPGISTIFPIICCCRFFSKQEKQSVIIIDGCTNCRKSSFDTNQIECQRFITSFFFTPNCYLLVRFFFLWNGHSRIHGITLNRCIISNKQTFFNRKYILWQMKYEIFLLLHCFTKSLFLSTQIYYSLTT